MLKTQLLLAKIKERISPRTYGYLLLSLALSVHLGAQRLAFCTPSKSERAQALAKLAKEEGRAHRTRDRAISHIDEAIILSPRDSSLYCIKAGLEHDLEEEERALETIDKAIALGATHAAALSLKASILNSLGRAEEALKVSQQAMKLDPNPNFRHAYYDILMHLGRFAQAERELSIDLEKAPQDWKARTVRVKANKFLKNWQKMIVDLTYLIDHEVNRSVLSRVYAFHDRGVAYLNLKKYDKAEADLKAAIKLAPDTRPPHADLLEVYKATGQKALAASEAQKIKKLDEDLGGF